MDALITAAGRALAAGDVLRALNLVALRDDAAGLALRGIAMARLGDLELARRLLSRAARAFGARESVARARCVVAQAEIALVSRELGWPLQPLADARALLAARGDHDNAAHAAGLIARRLLLVGRLPEAGAVLADVDAARLPPALRASHELTVAGLAIRQLSAARASAALQQARQAAATAGIAALTMQVETMACELSQPVARRLGAGATRLLTLADVEALLASDALIVDACRLAVMARGTVVPLGRRPVLFALARTLALAGAVGASRDLLVQQAFRARRADESYRARLRVEIGRLRRVLHGLARIDATPDGFVMSATQDAPLQGLAPLSDTRHGRVLALLADGQAWSSSALALALGLSPRTVQRALGQLAQAGQVSSTGRGPARRWLTPPLPGSPTTLLLPGPLPGR